MKPSILVACALATTLWTGAACADGELPALSPAEVKVVQTRKTTARFYPEAAARANKAGQATISCIIGKKGWVADCEVREEEPAGYGFGAKAVQLAKLTQFSRTTKAGAPTAGRSIVIPMDFKVPAR